MLPHFFPVTRSQPAVNASCVPLFNDTSKLFVISWRVGDSELKLDFYGLWNISSVFEPLYLARISAALGLFCQLKGNITPEHGGACCQYYPGSRGHRGQYPPLPSGNLPIFFSVACFFYPLLVYFLPGLHLSAYLALQ